MSTLPYCGQRLRVVVDGHRRRIEVRSVLVDGSGQVWVAGRMRLSRASVPTGWVPVRYRGGTR